jgi:hypothetical protein
MKKALIIFLLAIGFTLGTFAPAQAQPFDTDEVQCPIHGYHLAGSFIYKGHVTMHLLGATNRVHQFFWDGSQHGAPGSYTQQFWPAGGVVAPSDGGYGTLYGEPTDDNPYADFYDHQEGDFIALCDSNP